MLWTVLLFGALSQLIVAVSSQNTCGDRVFGRTNLIDCASLLLDLPDAPQSHDPTPKLLAHRWFAEPQFLDPPFSPLLNQFEMTIEQIPKFWRQGQ